MKDVQEFKDFLSIDFMEEHKAFGHYPFQIFSENEGKFTIGAMVLSNVRQCYEIFHDTMKSGASRCYMSVDFPPMEGQIDHDFIAVFSYEASTRDMDLVAIPYNKETGERYPEIDYKDNDGLRKIYQQFALTVVKLAGVR